MDKQKNNSEETYKENAVERNNRKISIRILIVGIIISCILCGIAFVKQNNAKKTNEERAKQAYAQSQATVDQAKKRLEEITTEFETLEPQINSLKSEINIMRNEQQTIFMQDRGFSARYNAKETEINTKQTELSKLQSQYMTLEQEQFMLKNRDYTVYYSLVEPITYMVFYYIAAGVFALTALISLIYFLATRRK